MGRNTLRLVQCVCDEMIGTSKGESLSLYILELVITPPTHPRTHSHVRVSLLFSSRRRSRSTRRRDRGSSSGYDLLEERDERETFMDSQTASLDLELKFEVGDGDR